MQTSSRPYYGHEQPVGKRGHVPQLSISDDGHHVTEAIGDMYGDHQYNGRDSRPLSFVTSSTVPTTASPLSPATPDRSNSSGSTPPRSFSQRKALGRTTTDEPIHPGINGQGMNIGNRRNSAEGEVGGGGSLSPSPSLRRQPSTSETANSHFPLNDIDYESNPNAIAQELNNLSALRRMSMDVNAAGDPDLPSFNSSVGIPTTPPADPDDSARLYWVPASVHPELAPMEFKTFLDKKVKSLKRRSEERQGTLSPDSLEREGSNASLRRRKSMLSRQIDNTDGRGADGYEDGADRLERRRSRNTSEMLNPGVQNLQDLETLVNEPEKVLQRLSLENEAQPTGDDDKPILPAIPPSNNSLKRSTRTTYRRGGSLRRGERTPFSKRAAQLGGTGDSPTEQAPSSALSASVPQDGEYALSRVQTEPAPGSDADTENFSRPNRSTRRGVASHHRPDDMASSPSSTSPEQHQASQYQQRSPSQRPQQRHFVSQIASNGRLGVPLGKQNNVPSIVETPPDTYHHPQRTSSHAPPPAMSHSHTPPGPIHPHSRASLGRANQNAKPSQTLNDMTQHPSPLPGNNTRTDNLSFIPTLTEDKKADSKRLKDKKERDGESSRRSGWSWGSLLGSEEKEKEKERRRAEEMRKTQMKVGKQQERGHDNTRLDLLQTTMDNNRGRESLVLDRGDIRLEEERKKESSRKSAGSETKKEKESGFFSHLLGGGKKKGDRDSTGKKNISRNLSPEPPVRILRPDIDYNWTRFSILEERAIYRMAHIKLANPRRALHSQVLLSNFMYSYLAKVQQMHPQANLPQSPSQRQQAAQQKSDQPEEFAAYQKYQEQQQRQQELEDQRNADGTPAQGSVSATQQDNFMDMDYDYDQNEHDGSGHRPQSRASQRSTRPMEASNGYGNTGRRGGQRQYESSQMTPYVYQQGQFDEPERADDDDMW